MPLFKKKKKQKEEAEQIEIPTINPEIGTLNKLDKEVKEEKEEKPKTKGFGFTPQEFLQLRPFERDAAIADIGLALLAELRKLRETIQELNEEEE
jgi:hypothetical protein